jgi:hypothetical protein
VAGALEYRRRVLDDEIDALIEALPAIALEGPKGVGKTRTASQRAGTVRRLDDPAVLAIAEADPARLLDGTPPVLLDEWQRLPEVWDQSPAPCRFPSERRDGATPRSRTLRADNTAIRDTASVPTGAATPLIPDVAADLGLALDRRPSACASARRFAPGAALVRPRVAPWHPATVSARSPGWLRTPDRGPASRDEPKPRML